jgi:tRNA dimethylallyltransferase
MINKINKPIVCLMGPTASGKTPLAVELVQHYPFEIISVDSAMIYREMNIGTAKPTADVLKIAPHRLIDMLDPSETYSAGQFCEDAIREITTIHAQNKIPLLVGGTMMYFRALQQGLAPLPKADAAIRAALQARADQYGWAALHAELMRVDPDAAKRINLNDSQRIQRALEVFQLTGKTMSAWQSSHTSPIQNLNIINIALMPDNRAFLHDRIMQRFDAMLSEGFIEEVTQLFKRENLHPDLPSIRSVGYRQAWDYLAGVTSYDEMRDKAIAATRQLAKRQMTWLRSWPELTLFTAESTSIYQDVEGYLSPIIAAHS